MRTSIRRLAVKLYQDNSSITRVEVCIVSSLIQLASGEALQADMIEKQTNFNREMPVNSHNRYQNVQSLSSRDVGFSFAL
jgi:hypothetical protein